MKECCPRCRSPHALPILYGLPYPSTLEKLARSQREGKPPPFVLGGCIVEDDSPLWVCDACGFFWGTRGDARPEQTPSTGG